MRTPQLRLITTFVLAVLTLLVVAWLAGPSAARAQSQQYHMDKYDSAISVNPDGSLNITETLAYSFDSGTFRRGLRVWDLDKVDSITDVQVFETTNGQKTPYTLGSFDPDETRNPAARTYGLETADGKLRLRWIYGQTSNRKR